MKRLLKAFVCVLVALLLCSCTPEADFVISKETEKQTESERDEKEGIFVVINKNSLKYHLDPDCTYVSRMSPENRLEITVPDTEYLIAHGYSGCSGCAGEK